MSCHDKLKQPEKLSDIWTTKRCIRTETGPPQGQATLILPECGEHDLYRWPLSTDLADAIVKGKRGEMRIDPDAGWPLPRLGSSLAIGKVHAQ
jgi:hypothetical protein